MVAGIIAAEAYKFEKESDLGDNQYMDLPLDCFGEFAAGGGSDFKAESIEDGLIASLNNLGRVDIEYIAQVTGHDMREIIENLRGAIYRNPLKWEECWFKGFETSDEYLSGNIIKKYHIAEEANKKYPGVFKANIEALRVLLPDFLEEKEIYITLGSPWVPTDIIDDFIEYLSGEKAEERYYCTRRDPLTGIWEIPHKNRYKYTRARVRDSETYGTPRMGMLRLLENALNMKNPVLYDRDADNKDHKVDQKETLLAIEKQNLLIDTFRRWVWTDPARADRLKQIYDETYAGIRKRNFNGSYLTFPGMNKDVELYPYQKNAVARILFTPNTLLAHDVGSGKTYVMVAAGMEMRRLGMSKKNLYVVPNNLVGQWRSIFLEMYPNANLLIVEPKSFTADKRNSVLRSIKNRDYDGIIMAYSCFDRLPLSEGYYKKFYKEQKTQITEANIPAYKQLKKFENIDNKLRKVHEKTEKFKGSGCFDELGINMMFVDEAHNYKNVPVETKITNNHSISTTGSEKCRMMLDKVRCVQRENGGRGVVFATGTPITNSVTDIFVMQRYLQNGELTLLGLQNFDSWIGMFAEKVSAYEIDVDTNSYHLVTRFSRFHNLPELTSILASIADFHAADTQNGIPVLNGYSDSKMEGSPYFIEYLKKISQRADDVRNHRIDKRGDNLLKITTDGRKAALDMRLIDKNMPPDLTGKVETCAENVFRIYEQTKQKKSAQLVFCDSSTPKKSFNMYDELRHLLIVKGVCANEIAFIHDYETDKSREKLFKAVREGEIRVLIGSTFKLGLGVNVQDRLIAIHHLDLPWRPADMVQREGRILRQGNTNPQVQIFRYITKGSFDAYSWQLLETKQRFISQLLSGAVSERNGSDIDETVLNYAEIKALAVGDPRIKRRCEVMNNLERERFLQKEYMAKRARLMQEKDVIPDKIRREKEAIENCKKDKALYKKSKRLYTDKEAKELRGLIIGKINASFGKDEETFITECQGFSISIPAYMQTGHPLVMITGNGKYYLEIGSESGISIRLNNFFESFDKKIEEHNGIIEGFRLREAGIKEELARDESREDSIAMLTSELEELDEELGLEK